MSLLWVLNMSDGNSDLLDIAERSGLPYDIIWKAAQVLSEHGLVKLTVARKFETDTA